MKTTMTCRQMGGTCDATITAGTSAEVARKMTAHVLETHPEVANRMKNMTPEEHRRWEADFHRNWDEAQKMAEHQ
jgi:hypothetical protein